MWKNNNNNNNNNNNKKKTQWLQRDQTLPLPVKGVACKTNLGNYGNMENHPGKHSTHSGYDLLHLSEMLHHSTILALLENYSVPHNLLFKPHRQSLHKVVGRNVLHCYSTKRHLKWKQRCTFTSTTPEDNKVTDTERNLANKKKLPTFSHFTLRRKEHVEAAHAQ